MKKPTKYTFYFFLYRLCKVLQLVLHIAKDECLNTLLTIGFLKTSLRQQSSEVLWGFSPTLWFTYVLLRHEEYSTTLCILYPVGIITSM